MKHFIFAHPWLVALVCVYLSGGLLIFGIYRNETKWERRRNKLEKNGA